MYENCCFIKNNFSVFFDADTKLCSVHIKCLLRIPFGLYYQEINRVLRHRKTVEVKAANMTRQRTVT